MKRSIRWLPVGLLLTLGLLLGMLGFSLWEKTPASVEHVVWASDAQWIAPYEPTYRFYARHNFYIPDQVQAGWLRLSADNNFTLYVNGRRVAGTDSVYDNSASFASKFSERTQEFRGEFKYQTYSIGNFVLSNPRNWKFSFYVDLTPYLSAGKNTIALEVEKEQTNPRVVVEGAVYTVADSSPIKLTTGATTWRVSNLFQNREELLWFDLNFPDENWSQAQKLGVVKEATYSWLSQNLFDRRLQGTWIAGNQSPQGQMWLRRVWSIPATKMSRAYIRFAGKGQYSLLLNGALVNHYEAEDANELHLVEVTKLIKTDNNILAVSLAAPLDVEATENNSIGSHDSVQFFLDGWVETDDGGIIGAIATDKNWTTLNQPVPGWTEGAGEGQPVNLMSLPEPQQFQRTFEGNAYFLNYPNYLWHQSLWQLAGIVFAFIYALILGLWLLARESWWDNLSAGAAILAPGTLFLIGIGLLKHRYAEAERGLLFAQPQSNYLILLVFAAIVLLTLLLSRIKSSSEILPRSSLWFLFGLVNCVCLGLVFKGHVLLILLISAGMVSFGIFWTQRRWQLQDCYLMLQRIWESWGQWFLLILVIAIGFGLRLYQLDFSDLDWDENVSWDATRGILRTGAPIATAGNWYSRSPAYHYMLAFWLKLIGDSAFNARLLSVLWGTATLVLIYLFTRAITGKVWIALLTTAVFAIDPFALFYSRNIRFYQVVQFMTIAVFWSFCKGFIERAGRHYHYIFFCSLIFLLLSQEVNVTLTPVFLIGFLYFYRPFSLLKDKSIVIGSLMTIIIYGFDGIFFSIKSVTPLVALSSRTEALMRFHLSNLEGFLSIFFVGYSRCYVIYTFFFLAGFIYFLIARNAKFIFLFSSVIIYLLTITLLSSTINPRYTYGIYSLFVILSIYSAISIIEEIGYRLQKFLPILLPIKNILTIIVLGVFILNIEPTRVLAGYQSAINIRNHELLEYVKQNKQAGDIVISNSPPTAANTLGKLDYHFSQVNTVEFGNLFSRNGQLIDRAAGSVEISNKDQMSNILSKARRVWIHLDLGRETLSNSEIGNLITILGKTVKESFGSRLRLWQQEDGSLFHIPNEGKDLGNY